MRKFFIIPIVLVAIVITLVALRSPGPAAPFPRLVILYATCSLNKNYLEPYNRSIQYTPNFKAFGKESIVFTKYETEVGCSGPAYASLFTGSHVYRHGVYYQPKKLEDKNYLIAEAFRDNGYDTFFWNTHPIASAQYNYAQGIKPGHLIHRSPQDGKTLTMRDGDFRLIMARLKLQPSYKAFVQISFTMTHAPYYRNSNVAATEKFCSQYPRECEQVSKEDLVHYSQLFEQNHADLQTHFDRTTKALNLNPEAVAKLAKTMEIFYKSSVNLLDKSFGGTMKVLQKDGMLDQSLIVFTSDHGEVLYREGSETKWGHCSTDPEVLNPPLMIRIGNGRYKSYLYSSVASSIDVFPTLAGLTGLKFSSQPRLEGNNLSNELFQGKSNSEAIAYSCMSLRHPSISRDDASTLTVLARSDDSFYKLIPSRDGSSKMELLQWQNEELKEASFDPTTQLNARIDQEVRNYRNLLIAGYSPPEPDPKWAEERERLRSLGYIK